MAMRVNQLAKYLQTTSQVVLALLEDIGVEDKTHSSAVDYEWAVKVSDALSRKPPDPWEDKPKKPRKKKAAAKTTEKTKEEASAEAESRKPEVEVIVHHRTSAKDEAEETTAVEESPAEEKAAETRTEEAPVEEARKEEPVASEEKQAEVTAQAEPAKTGTEASKSTAEQPKSKSKKKKKERKPHEARTLDAEKALSEEEAEKRRQQRALLAKRFQSLKQAPTAGKKDAKLVPSAPKSMPGSRKGPRQRQRGRGAASWKREKRERRDAQIEREIEAAEKEQRTLRINETTTVSDIASGLGIPPAKLIQTLFTMGMTATINQRLDGDTIQILADEFGFDVEEHSVQEDLIVDMVTEQEEGEKVNRAPVVTIMGHVDHGKTKLLDAVRSSNVVAQEAGGITQHLSAFNVTLDKGQVCFLDTPGHEAFTAMRYRGAQVTDIVILVVAADDGVMPQTIEAINHAKAAEVPIIVAINKMDVPGANVDRVKQQLAEQGLQSVDWGGKTETVPISALKKEGIEDLLETILLQAEIMELTAVKDCPARATVLEARLDRGRGAVATVLVQQGTLQVGDAFVAGAYSGKVRGMYDETGEPVEEAGPSTPVEVLGLMGVPSAGDPFHVVPDERSAKQYAIKLQQAQREREMQRRHHVSLSNLFDAIKEGQVKELFLVVKADVQGTAEALVESFESIQSDKVRVRVIHSGVGAVSESDVQLAAASDAVIIGFHVRVSPAARDLASRENVEIETYDVIYEAIENIRKAMEGLLDKKLEERITGQAEVREVFRVSKIGTVIGTLVTDGTIRKNSKVRVFRNDQVVHDGVIDSLRRFKDDVREVISGQECGIGIEKFQDIKQGDILETYEFEEVAQTL